MGKEQGGRLSQTETEDESTLTGRKKLVEKQEKRTLNPARNGRATKRTRTRIKAVKRKERPLPARTKRCPVRFLLQSLNLHLAYLKKLLKCQLIQMILLIVYAKMFHGVK